VAVIVTFDRPELLSHCIQALLRQDRLPNDILIVDNGSNPPASAPFSGGAPITVLRRSAGFGPASAYRFGIDAAIGRAADHVWLMDDDAAPAQDDCLSRLLATASVENAAITSPLVVDIDHTERLAFPMRIRGRTMFHTHELADVARVRGFAHLFNGALIAASAFETVGLPDERLVIRGDEVDFMLRVRRAGLLVVTDCRTQFLHPGSGPEIHPILGGRFYAVVPPDPLKRAYQFRNRGWIFSRHGMLLWLLADHVRYACWFILNAHDPAGYAEWLRYTWRGVLGQLGQLHPGRASGARKIDEVVL